MFFRDYMISLIPLVAISAGVSFATSCAAEDKAAKPDAIAKDWRYEATTAKETGWRGIGPLDSPRLYTESGTLTGASLEGAWNFYARKCGADKKYSETTQYAVAGEGKGGQYAIHDYERPGDPRITTFGFVSDGEVVSVQLSQSSDKEKIYVTITVGRP